MIDLARPRYKGIWRPKTTVVLTISLFAVTSGWACTVCDSDASRQVREGIFGADFGSTLVSVLAPFPILALIIGLLLWAPGVLKPKNMTFEGKKYERRTDL